MPQNSKNLNFINSPYGSKILQERPKPRNSKPLTKPPTQRRSVSPIKTRRTHSIADPTRPSTTANCTRSQSILNKNLEIPENDPTPGDKICQNIEEQLYQKKCAKISNELKNILLRVETHYTKFALAFDHSDLMFHRDLEKLESGELLEDENQNSNRDPDFPDENDENYDQILQGFRNRQISQQKDKTEAYLSKILINTSKIAGCLFNMLEHNEAAKITKDVDFHEFLENSFEKNKQLKTELRNNKFRISQDLEKLDVNLKNLIEIAEEFFNQTLRRKSGGKVRFAGSQNSKTPKNLKNAEKLAKNEGADTADGDDKNSEKSQFYQNLENAGESVDESLVENSFDLILDELTENLNSSSAQSMKKKSLLTNLLPVIKIYLNKIFNEKSLVELKLKEAENVNSQRSKRITDLEATVQQSDKYFDLSQKKILNFEKTVMQLKEELETETQLKNQYFAELEELTMEDRKLEMGLGLGKNLFSSFGAKYF